MTGTNCCKSSSCFPPLNPPHTVYKVEKRGGKPLTPTTKRRKLHSPTTTHTWPHHDSLMIPSPHIFSQQNRTGTRPRPRGPSPQHSTDLRPHPSPPPPNRSFARSLSFPGLSLSRHTIPSQRSQSREIITRCHPVFASQPQPIQRRRSSLATTHFFLSLPSSSSHGCFLPPRPRS